jgi:hypothetical protein
MLRRCGPWCLSVVVVVLGAVVVVLVVVVVDVAVVVVGGQGMTGVAVACADSFPALSTALTAYVYVVPAVTLASATATEGAVTAKVSTPFRRTRYTATPLPVSVEAVHDTVTCVQESTRTCGMPGTEGGVVSSVVVVTGLEVLVLVATVVLLLATTVEGGSGTVVVVDGGGNGRNTMFEFIVVPSVATDSMSNPYVWAPAPMVIVLSAMQVGLWVALQSVIGKGVGKRTQRGLVRSAHGPGLVGSLHGPAGQVVASPTQKYVR